METRWLFSIPVEHGVRADLAPGLRKAFKNQGIFKGFFCDRSMAT